MRQQAAGLGCAVGLRGGFGDRIGGRAGDESANRVDLIRFRSLLRRAARRAFYLVDISRHLDRSSTRQSTTGQAGTGVEALVSFVPSLDHPLPMQS